jgi:hypothetical protein
MMKITSNIELDRWTGTRSPGVLRMMLRVAEHTPPSPRKQGEVSKTGGASPLPASGERFAPRTFA